MLGARPEACHDEASTSSIGFILAGATFAFAFVAAQAMVAHPGGTDYRPAQFDRTAATALEVIVGHAGATSGGAAWLVDPDDIGRFGLAKEGEANFLDYVKIKALRNATLPANPNDAPDYEDVRRALAIRDGDFHIRSYPVLPGLDDPRWSKDPKGRLAYFAHYSGAASQGSMAAWANVTANGLNVSVAVKNTDTYPAIYKVNVGLGDIGDNSTLVNELRHTRLLLPGDVQTVWVSFPKLDWDDDLDGVKVDLADAYGNVLVAPYWLAAVPPAGSVSYGVLLQANQMYYVSGDEVKFSGDHYDRDGDHLNSDQTGRFVLVDPSGAELANTSAVLPKTNNRVYTYTCTTCTAVGNYTAYLYDATLTRRAVDTVHVSAERMFDGKKTLDPIATKEVSIIRDLIVNFNQLRFDEDVAPEGDIFGDDSNGPHEISSQLDRYTTIIIGSEVSQTALNAAETKYGIAEWVQRGGNLIVLGTDKMQSNWLEPVYHAAQITANGGISAPDITHPVLSTPNKLDYRNYVDRGRAWDIDGDAPFTHILQRSGSTNDNRIDTLAIASPGAYNDGTVVLTSYMPGSLTAPQDDMEAKRFLHNLLSQSFNMLFLDYGPPIPDGSPVGSAQRLVAIPHPNVPNAVVEVRLVMYAFG